MHMQNRTHIPLFLRQDSRYIVFVRVYAVFIYIYWATVQQHRYYADMKKTAHRINLQI